MDLVVTSGDTWSVRSNSLKIRAGTTWDASVLRVPAYVSSSLDSPTHETDPIAERKYWYLIERRKQPTIPQSRSGPHSGFDSKRRGPLLLWIVEKQRMKDRATKNYSNMEHFWLLLVPPLAPLSQHQTTPADPTAPPVGRPPGPPTALSTLPLMPVWLPTGTPHPLIVSSTPARRMYCSNQ